MNVDHGRFNSTREWSSGAWYEACIKLNRVWTNVDHGTIMVFWENATNSAAPFVFSMLCCAKHYVMVFRIWVKHMPLVNMLRFIEYNIYCRVNCLDMKLTQNFWSREGLLRCNHVMVSCMQSFHSVCTMTSFCLLGEKDSLVWDPRDLHSTSPELSRTHWLHHPWYFGFCVFLASQILKLSTSQISQPRHHLAIWCYKEIFWLKLHSFPSLSSEKEGKAWCTLRNQ